MGHDNGIVDRLYGVLTVSVANSVSVRVWVC